MTKIIHFNEMDVEVQEHYKNIWTAHAAENYDYDSPMGYGKTVLEAIADLAEQMGLHD
jgi:hypothetical protein